MKKITLFLSSLLLMLGATTQEARAQVSCVDLSTMSTGESKTVVMHVGGEGVSKYIGTFSTNNGVYYNNGKDGLTEAASEFRYTITKVTETTINIKDSHNGYFKGFTSGSGHFANGGNASDTFTFASVDSPVNALNSDDPAYTLTYSATGGLTVNYLTSSNDLCVSNGTAVSFQFVEASDLMCSLTLNGTDSNNGQYNFSKTLYVWRGANISNVVNEALSSASGTYTLNSTHEGTASGDATIEIQLTSTYNFPVKMNTPYFLQCRYLPNEAKWGSYAATFPFYMERVNASTTSTIAAGKAFSLNQIWYFERVATSPNEVVLRNMGTTPTGDVYNGITGTSGTPTYSANPTAYVLADHAATTGAFSLHIAGTNSYLGGHNAGVTAWLNGNSVNGRLSVWTADGAATDMGSAFNAIEVAWADLATAAAAAKAPAVSAEYLTKYVSDDYVATLQGKTDEVTVAGVAGTFSNATYDFTLDTDKYYMLYSAKDGYTANYAYADPRANTEGVPQDDNRKFYMKPDAQVPMSLLKFEPAEAAHQYYIRHANSGLYLCKGTDNTQADLPLSKSYADVYTVETTSVGNDVWGVKANTNNVYLNIFSSKSPAWMGLWHQNADDDPGSRIRIKAVEEIPVTLSSAGWSTLTLPMAVTIPTGVKAYYVTRNAGTEIYVEELSEVIPANTPVLLNGAASTAYNFGISSSTAAAPAGNKLLGTTMARTGFSTNDMSTPDVYGLYVSDATATFVPAYSATVPANKAVLPYANIDTEGLTGGEAAAFTLVLGGTTGISALAPARAEAQIYDLNGRRVLYPVPGQVYIKNGRKVILK